MSYTYEVPFARNLTGPAKHAARRLADSRHPCLQHRVIPITISARTNFSNAGGDTRPDVIPGVSLSRPGAAAASSGSTRRRSRITTAGQLGQRGPQHRRLPGRISVDFSVFKNFQMAETQAVCSFGRRRSICRTIRTSATISRTFDATNPGELTSAAAGRQVQFALKFLF